MREAPAVMVGGDVPRGRVERQAGSPPPSGTTAGRSTPVTGGRSTDAVVVVSMDGGYTKDPGWPSGAKPRPVFCSKTSTSIKYLHCVSNNNKSSHYFLNKAI